MATSVTVAEIQERVRVLCDLDTFSTTSPVTTAAILDLVKISAAMLAGIVKEAGGEQHLTTTSNVVTVAGTADVALPSGFSDLVRVSWIKSATEEIPLEVAVVDDFQAVPSPWNQAYPLRYRLIGQNLTLFPTPDAIYTLKLWYQTGLYVTSTATTIVARDGWDQWITLQTCVLVRARQQKDAAEFMMAQEKLEASIRRQLKRDKFGVRQVRDLRGDLFKAVTYPRKPW